MPADSRPKPSGLPTGRSPHVVLLLFLSAALFAGCDDSAGPIETTLANGEVVAEQTGTYPLPAFAGVLLLFHGEVTKATSPSAKVLTLIDGDRTYVMILLEELVTQLPFEIEYRGDVLPEGTILGVTGTYNAVYNLDFWSYRLDLADAEATHE